MDAMSTVEERNGGNGAVTCGGESGQEGFNYNLRGRGKYFTVCFRGKGLLCEFTL